MLALIVGGLFMVYSATHQSLAAVDLDPGAYLKRQVTFAALGVRHRDADRDFDYRFARCTRG